MQPRGISAIGTLFAFIFLLVILGVLWVSSGGPEQPISRQGPFLTPPSVPRIDPSTGLIIPGGQSRVDEGGVPLLPPEEDPTDDTPSGGQSSGGQSSGSSGSSIIGSMFGGGSSSNSSESPYAEYVSLSRGNATQSDQNKEYIEIEISRKAQGTFTVTGWVLESKKRVVKAPLGMAAAPFISGEINSGLPVTVGADASIYVVTGRPQNGVSFRVNKCTGYLDQFQSYYPNLRNECPEPGAFALRTPSVQNDLECIEFLEDDVNSCELFTETIPPSLTSSCRSFITNNLTYNGCVSAYRNEPDFHKNEWRMYLSRSQELWENTHDTIRLLDENGKLIASLTY